MPDQVTPFYFKTVVGMDNRSDVLDLGGRNVNYAQNCRFGTTPGAVTKRSPLAYYNSSEVAGTGGMLGAYRYYFSGGARLIAVRDNKVYVGDDSAGTLTSIRTLSNSGRKMAFVTYNNLLIGGNGYDNLWVYDGSSDNVTWELGSCKAVATTAAGSITRTSISYMITFDSDAYINGAISNEIASVTSKDIVLSHIPIGPLGSGHRKIYRKDNGTAGAYKFVIELTDDSQETYTDNDDDISAHAAVGSVTDDMPKGNILSIHKERLFISGNPVDQNTVWYSNPFLFHYIQADTNLDFLEIAKDDGDQIQGLPIHMGTMICVKQNTLRKVFISASSANVDPATWYADDPFSFTGTPAQWSICQTPLGIMYLGWDKWYLFDGSASVPFLPEFNATKILPSLYNNVIAYFNNSKLYASYADAETAPQNNNRVMVYDTNVKQYGVDTIAASCFAAAVGADESGELFIGSADSGYMFKAEEGDIWHRASSLSNLQGGTTNGLFLGGPEGNPILQVGASIAPLAIPEDVCIMWEDETSSPGSGWTEVVGTAFPMISTVAMSTGGTGTHTHTITGSLSVNDGKTVMNSGDGGPQANNQTHSHSLSAASDTVSAYPRNVVFRIFKKNSATTEYGFPVGSILMWDQSSAPDGWVSLSYLAGNYVRMGSTDLGIENLQSHQHTFSVASTAAGNSWDADLGAGTAISAPNHTHLVAGTTLSTDTNTFELDRAEFLFIKKVSDSSPWDGTLKYVYALMASATAESNGWEDMSATYAGKYLKISTTITTGSRSGYAHVHDVLDGTTGLCSPALAGPGGYNNQALVNHTHTYTATASSADLPDPVYLTFRLFRKLLGKTVYYNDAITTSYTNGLYVSPSMSISAESFGDLYFNASVDGTDSVSCFFRTAATEALVADGTALTVDHVNNKFTAVGHGYSDGDRVSIGATAYPAGVTGSILYYVVNVAGSDFKISLSAGGSPVDFSSNGTAVTSKKWENQVLVSGTSILATPNVWVQYLFEFIAADTTDSIPTLFYADGYVIKFNYRKSGALAETSVEFIYETGIMNHENPMVDKIYKRLAIEMAATLGSLEVQWTTENGTNTWIIDLARFPNHWQSFFHDNAMGEVITIRFYKNDLSDFLLREFKGFYVEQPMLI